MDITLLVAEVFPMGFSWAVAVAATFAVLASCLACRMFYNVFMHPLRQYPGPKLWAATRFPWCWHSQNGKLSKPLLELHIDYGPVVRVAPSELSYSTDTAWKTIYGQREVEMMKDPIFSISNPSGVPTILDADRKGHSRMRRLLAHAFSEKALQGQEGIVLTHVNKFTKKVNAKCHTGPIDVVKWFNFLTYDIMGDLAFGDELGCLDREDYDGFSRSIWSVTTEVVYTQILRYYKLYGLRQMLMPKGISGSRTQNLERVTRNVEKRIQSNTDRKDFLHYILSADEKKGMTDKELRGNSFTLLIAGSDTTATWLSGVLFYVLSYPHVHQRLTQEIRGAFKSEEEISFASTQNLEYFEAVTTEALRIYPPIAPTLQRRVPLGGETIDGRYVPAGTTVGVSHYVANRSPRNFHRPDDFLPERWLPRHCDSAPLDKDNKTSMQPFALGPRSCLGRNLARAEMRLIMTRLLWKFDLELTRGQEDWQSGQVLYGFWRKPPLLCNILPVKRD